MDLFTVYSRHQEDLHDGRLKAPGEEFELTAEEQKEPHNAAKIEEGVFVPAHRETKKERGAREKAEAEALAEAEAQQGDGNDNGEGGS